MKVALFYVLSGMLLLSAGLVVTLSNLFYCALCLVVSLACVAGLFVTLHAEFLGVVQIVIYVGAITVLIVFAILLTRSLADKTLQSINRLRVMAALVIGLLIPLMITMLNKTSWFSAPAEFKNTLPALGHLLLNEFVLPFEIVSLLLLIAMVGGIVIAKKGKNV